MDASINTRLWIGLAALAPVWVLFIWLGNDPAMVNTSLANAPPFTDAYPLGTDDLGRDIMARLARAALASIKVAGLATLVALVISYLLAWSIRTYLPLLSLTMSRILTGLLVAAWMAPFVYVSVVISTAQSPAAYARVALFILPTLVAAGLILGLRKEISFYPETDPRDRWTATGWRLLRLFAAVAYVPYILVFFTLASPAIYGAGAPFPASIVLGLALVPFLFRTGLQAPHALIFGVPSTLSWALLAGFFLSAIGMGASYEGLTLGKLFGQGHPMAYSASLVVLGLLVTGVVMIGDWIRLRFYHRLT